MVQPESRSLWSSWVDFWFGPSPLTTLHALRVLFGLVALLWLLPLAGQVDAFFGLAGWFDADAVRESQALPGSPIDAQAWSPIYVFGHDSTTLHAFYWGSLAVIVIFMLGLFTRVTAVLTWLIVIAFTTNPLIETDADVFLRLLSFYLMIGYLLEGLLNTGHLLQRVLSPFNHWLFARNDAAVEPVSSAATVAVRLIQIHVALAIVAMALHKLQLAEWWSGITHWYLLTRPSEINLDTLGKWAEQPRFYLSGLSLVAYAVLVWQLAFPFFAWRRGVARWILLGGAVIGCFGLMTLYRQPLMGPVFLVLCLAYLTPTEWARLLALFGRSREEV
jgi:hypothetical protein